MAERDHLQGSTAAPIQLLEYGDFECPFCGEAYPLVKEIQASWASVCAWRSATSPLTTVHPHAEHAAEAAEAADAQGHFWEMHDISVRESERSRGRGPRPLCEILGLDARRLLAEVRDGVHQPRVREDFRSGVRNGVNGTPTFFINGQRDDGQRVLDEMLASLTGAAV